MSSRWSVHYINYIVDINYYYIDDQQLLFQSEQMEVWTFYIVTL